MTFKLEEYYRNNLQLAYSCVDRIFLRGYVPILQSCAGFRYWSEQLRPDEPVTQSWIHSLARRFHTNVKKFAQERQIPIVESKAGQRKHLLADEYREKFTDDDGVYLIVKGFEQAKTFLSQEPRMPTSSKHRNLGQRQAFVIHYTFYIVDRYWGPMSIVICSHPPFNSKVFLNAHYWFERQNKKLDLELTRQTNAFVSASKAQTLQDLADSLKENDIRRVADRWTYRVLPILTNKQRHDTRFKYQWSIAQMEVCHNLVFHPTYPLAELFHRHIDLNRRFLSPQSIATTFGKKQSTGRPQDSRVSTYQAYDSTTVLKVQHFQSVIKQYNKHQHILRSECISNNSKRFGVGKLLTNFARLRSKMIKTLERFQDLQSGIVDSTINRGELAALAQTSELGSCRVPGIRLDNERIVTVLSLLPRIATDPRGFTSAHLRQLYVSQIEQHYTPSQASYDLRKLRAKQILEKVHKTRRYRFAPRGACIAALFYKLGHLFVGPTLCAATFPRSTAATPHPSGRRGPLPEVTPLKKLTAALAKHAGNVNQVSREIGRQPCVVRRWIKRHNIDLADYRKPVKSSSFEPIFQSLDDILNQLTDTMEVAIRG